MVYRVVGRRAMDLAFEGVSQAQPLDALPLGGRVSIMPFHTLHRKL